MTNFANGLKRHMDEWVRDNSLHLRPWGTWKGWECWTEGICPGYGELAESMIREDSVRLHRYAAHPRSSQAFAFNLFLPFRDSNREPLSKLVSDRVGEHLDIDEVRFEWVPPGRLLGELSGESPVGKENATGVDIVLWAWLKNGRRAVVLTEVKLGML